MWYTIATQLSVPTRNPSLGPPSSPSLSIVTWSKVRVVGGYSEVVWELKEPERGGGGGGKRKQRLFLLPSFLLKPEPGPGQASRRGRRGDGVEVVLGGGRWGRKRAFKHQCLHRWASLNPDKVVVCVQCMQLVCFLSLKTAWGDDFAWGKKNKYNLQGGKLSTIKHHQLSLSASASSFSMPQSK